MSDITTDWPVVELVIKAKLPPRDHARLSDGQVADLVRDAVESNGGWSKELGSLYLFESEILVKR